MTQLLIIKQYHLNVMEDFIPSRTYSDITFKNNLLSKYRYVNELLKLKIFVPLLLIMLSIYFNYLICNNNANNKVMITFIINIYIYTYCKLNHNQLEIQN